MHQLQLIRKRVDARVVVNVDEAGHLHTCPDKWMEKGIPVLHHA